MVKKDLFVEIRNNLDIKPSELEKAILEDSFFKMRYSDFEKLVNYLFSTTRSELIKMITSYFSKLVISPSTQFYHLIVENIPVKAPCNDMIRNYRYIFMYNAYMDCSKLLMFWSPTEPYFPLLKYIENSKPDIPIDYTYWLRRFTDLPVSLAYLKNNAKKIEFTDKNELMTLYKTIPQQYIKDFIDLLGNKSWYMDVIKDTDHFLEEIESD